MNLGLIVNAGSSSVKMAVLGDDLARVASVSVSEIGGRSVLSGPDDAQEVAATDHGRAVGLCLEALGGDLGRVAYAGHRVVHGGDLTAPMAIGPESLGAIEAAVPLAPLHNPANLAGIRALAAALPELPQAASFDTAFHATIPEMRRRYAVPDHIAARGIRRYGFHGLSYAGLVRRLPEISGAPLPARLLACHLGNGASLCAIREGQSVATTMGYSPVEGLAMGTRVGDIDANAVLRLAEEDGIDAARRLLNHESGLLGLSGLSDMRALEAAGRRDVIELFCDRVVMAAGAMIAAMGGIDAVAFTGGIGENSETVRERVVHGLAWTGVRNVWIVPADEEGEIAREARAVLGIGN
ncbi:MAG: acetate kinase [Paracoccaceae bacterium]|nr:acetate kinase [Paracoccaceae bacterium]